MGIEWTPGGLVTYEIPAFGLCCAGHHELSDPYRSIHSYDVFFRCGPCVAGFPQLAKVYEEAKDKGLVLISIDQDEYAATAANFFAKKGYTWPEFHDGGGEIENLMGSSGIPRLVLVDTEGQITYDGDGDDNKLRTHLAGRGQEFQELAPKPMAVPCAPAR
jgi:hypothetical protein